MGKIEHRINEYGGEIPRSGEGLREALFSQLERLRDGEIESAEARAFAGVSNAIIKTVEVQLRYEEMLTEGSVSRTLSNQGVLAVPDETKETKQITGGDGGTSASGKKTPAIAQPAPSARKAK